MYCGPDTDLPGQVHSLSLGQQRATLRRPPGLPTLLQATWSCLGGGCFRRAQSAKDSL